MRTETPQAKVALITGGAARIGACLVRHLHKTGYNIALHYRHSKTSADALAVELNEIRADSVYCIKADLLNNEAIDTMVKDTLTRWSKIDVLVNNASSFFPTPLPSINEEQWRDLMGTNAYAPALLSKACTSSLKTSKGCIVNISDIVANTGRKNFLIYSMAKSALNNLTRSLARELAPEIRVNALAPGVILPPNFSDTDDESETDEREALSISCLDYAGKAEDIAYAAEFLINNTYTTGQVLNVDGGRRLKF
ncbi:MAG: pteridine reductase [Gammaproteobacteria bacterium]|jgi:pteridine reductase|nr:pteridine reductase [Gammaproteobacteria bacterium]